MFATSLVFTAPALAVLCAGTLMASAGSTGAQQMPVPKAHTVTIEGMQYQPQTLTVHRGDRVTWINKDLFPHTVTASDKAFDSRSIAANASWTYVPRKPGDYAYGCTFHTTMKGMLIVQ